MEGGFSCSALRAHKQVTCERAGGVQVRWRGGQFARWRGRFSCVREGGGGSYVRAGGGGGQLRARRHRVEACFYFSPLNASFECV